MCGYDYFSCQVLERKAKPHIQVDIGGGQTKTFAPEEISAMVLTKMKETAEAYLGKKVRYKSFDGRFLHQLDGANAPEAVFRG